MRFNLYWHSRCYGWRIKFILSRSLRNGHCSRDNWHKSGLGKAFASISEPIGLPKAVCPRLIRSDTPDGDGGPSVPQLAQPAPPPRPVAPTCPVPAAAATPRWKRIHLVRTSQVEKTRSGLARPVASMTKGEFNQDQRPFAWR